MRKYTFLLIWLAVNASIALGNESSPPVLMVDAMHGPTLPDTKDLYTIKYKLVHADSAGDLARLVRSFTPPTSEIFPLQDGVIQVTDTATSLKKVYLLLKKNDLKPTPKMKEKWQKMEEREDERRIQMRQ